MAARLTEAAGNGTLSGNAPIVSTGIQFCTGIIGEHIVQRAISATNSSFEFHARTQGHQLAKMHNCDTIAMALRFLHVMGSEENRGAVVVSQLSQVFPDGV